MKKFLVVAIVLLLGGMMCGTSYAEFLLGEDSKGVLLESNDANKATLNIRLALQPRIEFGDLIKNPGNTGYASDADLYFRRIRLDLNGFLVPNKLKYDLQLRADTWDKINNTNTVSIFYAWMQWNVTDTFALLYGKELLPFSRVGLTDATRHLLVEYPASVLALMNFFGKSDAYLQPKLAAKGKVKEGMFAYEVAVADGWQNGDGIYSAPAPTLTVFKSDPLYMGRIELSPPGWAEGAKFGSHLGKGKHLTLAVDYAAQKEIQYQQNSFSEDRTLIGADLSGHYKGIELHAEYNKWNTKFTDPSKKEVEPTGWFVQAGYFIDGINVEPVVRYEVYDQDSNSSDKTDTISTVGVNWYLRGHFLKWGLNWVHAEYDKNSSNWRTNGAETDIYQLQATLIF